MVSLRRSWKEVEVGAKFGDRTVLGVPFSRGGTDGKQWSAVTRCSCGRISVCLCRDLIAGRVDRCRSCQIRKMKTSHGFAARGRKPLLYGVWNAMKNRCRNENVAAFKDYGGRGIEVCEEWASDFPAFMAWAVRNGYVEGAGLEIDRIDNNGNYEPGNCRWVTPERNGRNKRTSRVITAFGEERCLADWVSDARCVVARPTLSYRINHGWNPEDAISMPLKTNQHA